MSDLENILQTIRYCAGDYMKQEEGIQCFEWSDLWVLNEYIKKLQQENQQLKEVIEEAKDMLDLIIPELWNINNAMTYKVKAVRRVLDKVKDVK